MRLLRAYHVRLAETADPEAPLLAASRATISRRSASTRGARARRRCAATLDAAIDSAGHVRDRFSIDGWMALNDLAKTARRHGASA